MYVNVKWMAVKPPNSRMLLIVLESTFFGFLLGIFLFIYKKFVSLHHNCVLVNAIQKYTQLWNQATDCLKIFRQSVTHFINTAFAELMEYRKSL
jgi:hypothetical protein